MARAKKDDASLADAATSGLAEFAEEGTQEVLDDTEYTKVRFVGMSFDSLDDNIDIGDEHVFLVRARCTAKIEEASKVDGSIRNIRKMDVQSVVLHDGK